MKKLSVFLFGLILVLTAAGSASALSFTDTQSLNVALGEGPFAQYLWGDSITYQHNTPSDFEVPYDIVNSASLEISGYWIDGNNDSVEVSGEIVGNLVEGGSLGYSFNWSTWSWNMDDNPSVSTFDIASSFGIWTTGSPLDVTITANGDWLDGQLFLSTSTFTLDYDNAGPAPVPEPATMLLLGTGLAGMAAVRRRNARKA